jgi:hypothetical protein
MPTRGKQQSSESRIQLRPVSLEVTTIQVDGKRITPGFFTQIQRQSLIDEETGGLVGASLGLVNIHRKDTCPEEEHWHALWGTASGELRHAVETSPLDAKAYLVRKQESEAYCNQLTDLLALLLARHYHTHTLILNPLALKTRRTVTFSDGTSLQISSGRYNDAYEQIAHLEAARAALVQAMEAQEDQSPSLAAHLLPQADLSTPSLKAARRIQQELAWQDIVLAHPALYKNVPARAPLHLAEYSVGREHIRHSRYEQENWLVYDVPYNQRRASDWLLFWRSSAHSTDDITEEEVATVEGQLRPHIGALRVLLAEQAVRVHLKHIDQTARKLLSRMRLLPLEVGDVFSLPQTVRAALREEQQRFRAYTSRWQHSLQQIQETEQIYIL